jgi:heme oxygenase
MPFVAELRESTRAEHARLMAASIIGEDRQGHADRTRYLRFLTESHALLSSLSPVILAAVARLPADECLVRRELGAYAEQLAARCAMLRENIAALGGNGEGTPAGPATTALIAWAEALVKGPRPVAVLGIPVVMEGSAAALAVIAAARLRLRIPTPRAYTYLESHPVLDPDYGKRQTALLDSIGLIDRAFVIESARTMFTLYANFLDGRQD